MSATTLLDNLDVVGSFVDFGVKHYMWPPSTIPAARRLAEDIVMSGTTPPSFAMAASSINAQLLRGPGGPLHASALPSSSQFPPGVRVRKRARRVRAAVPAAAAAARPVPPALTRTQTRKRRAQRAVDDDYDVSEALARMLQEEEDRSVAVGLSGSGHGGGGGGGGDRRDDVPPPPKPAYMEQLLPTMPTAAPGGPLSVLTSHLGALASAVQPPLATALLPSLSPDPSLDIAQPRAPSPLTLPPPRDADVASLVTETVTSTSVESEEPPKLSLRELCLQAALRRQEAACAKTEK